MTNLALINWSAFESATRAIPQHKTQLLLISTTVHNLWQLPKVFIAIMAHHKVKKQNASKADRKATRRAARRAARKAASKAASNASSEASRKAASSQAPCYFLRIPIGKIFLG